MIITSHANPSINQTIAYVAGKPIEEVERELNISSIIKLASNENPLGCSQLALKYCIDNINKANLYPDANYYELRKAIAKYNNIDIDCITVGNGSENCLELLTKSFLNSNVNAIVDQYCFATIQILIKAYNAKPIYIQSKKFKHDINETIRQINDSTRMIFVVNPNNPTGTYITHNELLFLLKNTPTNVIIVIDEAYFEYLNVSDAPKSIELLKQYSNLVILRTFSKVFGMAGFRLGYIISSPEIAQILHKARLPFNVNFCASNIAIAALEDKDFLKKSITINSNGLLFMSQEYEKLKIPYIPSLGNFISIDMKQDTDIIYNKLLLKGIIVRPLKAYGLNTFFRVSIGLQWQNEKFLIVLKEILSEL